jgi:hypothetical protein
MNNKYNLDFYEAMICMNEYLNLLEDSYNDYYKDNVNETIIEQMKSDRVVLESMTEKYLELEEYQKAFNSLVTSVLYSMFINEVLAKKSDLSYLIDYVDSIDEEMMINDVTEYFNQILE